MKRIISTFMVIVMVIKLVNTQLIQVLAAKPDKTIPDGIYIIESLTGPGKVLDIA